MRTLYSFAIHIYSFLIRIYSLKNKKAKLWIDGRKELFDKIVEFKKDDKREVVWVHCASLGEFEQGRVLIEKIKNQKPHYAIVLTFFSPSGYEVRKNYTWADLIIYLPQDTPRNVQRFIYYLSPKKAFFVKYEYWYNYIDCLSKNKIPLYIVSAIFRPNQIFFKFYGKWFAQQLAKIEHFFVQDESSAKLLESINLKNYTITGDTRFDRVAQICSAPKRIPQFENLDKNKTIIIGSSWQKDEEVFAKLLDEYSNLKLIVVPHEIDHERIASVESIFEKQKSIKLSKTDESSNLSEFNVIIVDSIGLLSSIYQYGFFAHIGGGFGKGIHNILEAACYGMPIIFGPNYEKFEEAKSLIKLGGAYCVKNHVDLKNIFEKKLNNEIEIRQASEISKKFVENNIGASDKIFDSIF